MTFFLCLCYCVAVANADLPTEMKTIRTGDKHQPIWAVLPTNQMASAQTELFIVDTRIVVIRFISSTLFNAAHKRAPYVGRLMCHGAYTPNI